MYYVYGVSRSSLLIESTNSMITGVTVMMLLLCFTSGPVPHVADVTVQTSLLPPTQDDAKHHNSPARAPIEAWCSDTGPVVKNSKRGSHLPSSGKRWKRSCNIC